MVSLSHREKWQIMEDLSHARTIFQSALDEQRILRDTIDHLARKDLPQHRSTTKIYDQIKKKIQNLEKLNWEAHQRQKEWEQKMETLRKLAIANRLIGSE